MSGLIEPLGAFAPLVINAAKAIVVLIVGWSIAGMVRGVIKRRMGAIPHRGQGHESGRQFG